MLADSGTIILGLSLLTALYGVGATLWGVRREDERWVASGRNAAYALPWLLGLATLLLVAAFLLDLFHLQYVAQHSSRDLPIYLKVSALWGGQEGSLLLWCFLQTLFAALAVGLAPARARPLVPWTTFFLHLVTVFFVGVALFFSNPFVTLPAAPFDGQGLNPLLRHPGMIFHPPALYLGYVGLAVPFAFALAALVSKKPRKWVGAARGWLLASWLFLGLGLFLGMRWAYDVLGWGGYWAWDPVENAGLMPWLTATALLHGIVMQREGRGFRGWNFLLSFASFALVLFGTFATRSGVIQSVHAYARSDLAVPYLGALILAVVGPLALLFLRRSLLKGEGEGDEASLLSREGAFFLTLVVFATLTVSVLLGSVLPTLTEALVGSRFEAGPEWFDRVTAPQFGALLLLLGICPLLGYAVASLRRLGWRGVGAVAGAALLVAGAAAWGFTRPVSLVGFALAGLAGSTALVETGWDAARLARRQEIPFLNALARLFRAGRHRYGGYLVHLGVVLMALGVIGTRAYALETAEVLSVGEPVEVGGYTLLYEELRQEQVADHVSTFAFIAVYEEGEYVTTLLPRLNRYPNFEELSAVPAVLSRAREDLYLVLAGWGEGGATVTLRVMVQPLVNFLWLGGLLLMAGGAIAAWPLRRAAREDGRVHLRRAWNALGLVTGVVLFVAAGWSMWGGTGAVAGAGRPLPGQPAPDFRLTLLNGETVRLADLRGQVVVVNFWTSWCDPCREELPDLQAFWSEVEGQGAVLLGVGYQEEEGTMREAREEFGLTYPLGVDEGDRTAELYGITGVPETFVIDEEGKVAYVHVGPVTAEQLLAEVAGLGVAP